MEQIGRAQNEDFNLRRYLAAGRYYRVAKWLHFGGLSFTVILALISPLVLVFVPGTGPALGAVAGAWLFLSRLALEPISQRFQERGAAAQEMFDCELYGLHWNDSMVRPLSEEEIRSASGSMKHVDEVRDWYPTKEQISWPESVLVCQRSNAVWGRRQHRFYAWALIAVAASWGVVGIVIALAHGASLGSYLVTIGLPSLPALLGASEFAQEHLADAEKRQLLEDQADSLIEAGDAEEQDLREIQDQLFGLRSSAELIPNWFYRILRNKFEKDMQYAASRTMKRQASDEGRYG